jgi:hypothetical protein
MGRLISNKRMHAWQQRQAGRQAAAIERVNPAVQRSGAQRGATPIIFNLILVYSSSANLLTALLAR